ncbi:peroxiredoxin [Kerstersia sp.]|uniref:peroxiredoxin n=1 Tax=Kerstersia sp. TaxID=1930783 RepID=UPI003F8DA199
MKTIGDKLDSFRITGVKPGFTLAEENGVSAFEDITESTFPGKWKVIYFYPKDFSSVCPTEIIGFDALTEAFEERDAVLLGGSSDNEHVKLAWRREQNELARVQHHQFADTSGSLIDQLGIRERTQGVALRATLIVDPDNIIQHISVNGLKVGRNPDEVLRVLDALLTDEPAVCNRPIGG